MSYLNLWCIIVMQWWDLVRKTFDQFDQSFCEKLKLRSIGIIQERLKKIWFDILMTSKNAYSWTRRSAIAEKASCICATMVMQYHSMSTLSAKLYSKKPLKRSDLFLKPPLQSPDLLVPLPRIRFPFRSRVCSRRENASCSCQSCVRDRGPYTQLHLTSVNLSVSVL